MEKKLAATNRAKNDRLCTRRNTAAVIASARPTASLLSVSGQWPLNRDLKVAGKSSAKPKLLHDDSRRYARAG